MLDNEMIPVQYARTRMQSLFILQFASSKAVQTRQSHHQLNGETIVLYGYSFYFDLCHRLDCFKDAFRPLANRKTMTVVRLIDALTMPFISLLLSSTRL